MKALISTQVGGPETLVLSELPDPRPKAGMAIVEVKAVGVNYPDVLIIEDKYQFKPARPFAPGGEVSGIVKEVGEGVTEVKVGDGSTVGVDVGSESLAILRCRTRLSAPQCFVYMMLQDMLLLNAEVVSRAV